MSFAEAVAFCGLMVAIISVAGILLEFYNRRLKHRERELELRLKLAKAESGQRAAAVPKFEERLRVLERIVTDRGDPLAAEIEALRRAPELEKQP